MSATPSEPDRPTPPVAAPPPNRRPAGSLVLGLVVGMLIGGLIGGAIAVTGVVYWSSCPCPAVLVLEVDFVAGPVVPRTGGTAYTFNVTAVENGDPTYGDVEFSLWNGSGQGVLPSSNWTLQIAGPAGPISSTYDPGTATWSGLSTVPIQAGQSWTFVVPWPSLVGGVLALEGTNAHYSGTCAVGIP